MLKRRRNRTEDIALGYAGLHVGRVRGVPFRSHLPTSLCEDKGAKNIVGTLEVVCMVQVVSMLVQTCKVQADKSTHYTLPVRTKGQVLSTYFRYLISFSNTVGKRRHLKCFKAFLVQFKHKPSTGFRDWVATANDFYDNTKDSPNPFYITLLPPKG